MPTLGIEAEYMRLNYVSELVDLPQLIQWADKKILQSPIVNTDLIELSLSSKKSWAELDTILGSISDSTTLDIKGYTIALESTLALLSSKLLEGEITAWEAAKKTYIIFQHAKHIPEEHYQFLVSTDDHFFCLKQGYYQQSLEVATGEMLEYLSQFSDQFARGV